MACVRGALEHRGTAYWETSDEVEVVAVRGGTCEEVEHSPCHSSTAVSSRGTADRARHGDARAACAEKFGELEKP